MYCMIPKNEDVEPDQLDFDFYNKIINYKELINKSTEGFVGREWLRDEIDSFLKNDKHRFFLILGEPGSGKTAFLADLIKHRCYPYHFIGKGTLIYIISDWDWQDPVRFAESISYQLIRDYGGWVMDWEEWNIKVEQHAKDVIGCMVGAEVEEFNVKPCLSKRPNLTVEQEAERFLLAGKMIGVYIKKISMDIEQVVRQLLKVPLSKIGKKWPDINFVVIVDGLEEAKCYSCSDRTIYKMLQNSCDLPSNIRFLLSSTPGSHLEKPFLLQTKVAWLSKNEKGETDPRNLEDARDYVKRLSEEKIVEDMLDKRGLSKDEFLEQVVSASEGNFEYLHLYAQELKKDDQTLLDLKAPPKELYGVYEYFLGRTKEKLNDNAFWDEAYKPVLSILAVAQEPLTRKQISNFSMVNESTVATVITSIEQLLEIFRESSLGKLYKIYHKTFGEYIVSEENEDYIGTQEPNMRIVKYYSSGKGSWEEDFAIKYLMAHMIAAQAWDELETLLTNVRFLNRKQKKEEQYCFQNDFVNLLRNKEIPTDKLVGILEKILETISTKLEIGKEKADLLDIFSYWINEFGKSGSQERWNELKRVANKCDRECGVISKELAIQYLGKGEYDWALRFAELYTWVYQRAGDY